MTKESRRVFRFGDVITVRHYGGRPGVVISVESHNATALDVVAMMITKQEHHAMRGGAIVLADWETYGLKEPSVVKPVIFSNDVEDSNYIGHVNDDIKAKLRESMARIFGGKVKK